MKEKVIKDLFLAVDFRKPYKKKIGMAMKNTQASLFIIVIKIKFYNVSPYLDYFFYCLYFTE